MRRIVVTQQSMFVLVMLRSAFIAHPLHCLPGGLIVQAQDVTIVFHSNKFKALIYLNEKLILSTFALPAFDNMHKLTNIMRVLIPDTFRNLFWNSV